MSHSQASVVRSRGTHWSSVQRSLKILVMENIGSSKYHSQLKHDFSPYGQEAGNYPYPQCCDLAV